MKNRLSIIRLVAVMAWAVVIMSCRGDGYQDLKFGGMNGRVQKVTVTHRAPEMWRGGVGSIDIMSIDALVYDINGYEICSALMDSVGHIESEAESLFENGVCVRSTQKVSGTVVARLSLLSKKKGELEYSKEIDGKVSRMTIRKSSFGRRFKTVVIEDGKVVSVSIMRVDRKGYPVRIKETDKQNSSVVRQKNVYDENHNIIEKRVSMTGEEKEQVISTDYFDFDEYGNWTEARTYNRNNLPVEILQRKIEYW